MPPRETDVTRVGVIADTHCPEFMDQLPERVLELLQGVDLILHAGDVSSRETLDQLGRLAPVAAVRGDHDSLDLPRSRLLKIAGRTIAVVHGNRSHLIEEPITFLGTITLGHLWPRAGIHRWLRRRFPEADAIIYGHTHFADSRRLDGALLFNPGAVYQVGGTEARRRLARGPGWFEWSWLQVIRHRRVIPRPSVGFLNIGPESMTTEVVYL